MPFSPKTWVTGDTVNASELNRVEQGVVSVESNLDATVNPFPAVSGGDDAAELISRLNAGDRHLTLRSGNYLWNQAVTLPANTLLEGVGKVSSKVLHNFNGDMLTVGGECQLKNIYFDGNAKTGKGLLFTGTDGAQVLEDVQVMDFDGVCLDFAYLAGSRFRANRLDARRTSAGTGTGRYAIVVADTLAAQAVPRTIQGLQTHGTCAVSFGGCDSFELIGGAFADLSFSANSKTVRISAARWLNQTACNIDGDNHAIVGNDIAPALTVVSGVTSSVIGPNSYNTSPFVTDNSGSDSNLIYHPSRTYTPTFTTANSDGSLGNGTLNGFYSRQGNLVHAIVDFTVGSTTNMGTGELRFSVPITRISTTPTFGPANITDNSPFTQYTAVAQVPGAVGYARLLRDTSGGASATSPITFATSDTIRFTITYSL